MPHKQLGVLRHCVFGRPNDEIRITSQSRSSQIFLTTNIWLVCLGVSSVVAALEWGREPVSLCSGFQGIAVGEPPFGTLILSFRVATLLSLLRGPQHLATLVVAPAVPCFGKMPVRLKLQRSNVFTPLSCFLYKPV